MIAGYIQFGDAHFALFNVLLYEKHSSHLFELNTFDQRELFIIVQNHKTATFRIWNMITFSQIYSMLYISGILMKRWFIEWNTACLCIDLDKMNHE